MIYITGDCHGNYKKFSVDWFPEQKQMTRDDFVIVCGDFGLWHDDKTEQWWFKWLSEKPFTLLFVDGNHENFDRLYSDEFEVVDFHGGKAHKIRDNIYHLMRGYVFDLCGNKFFAFGGAKSTDIQDGILEPNDYENKLILEHDYKNRIKRGSMVRVNHIDWWKREVPSEEEMGFGLQTLSKNDNQVDFIVTHAAPADILHMLSKYKIIDLKRYEDDRLAEYLNTVYHTVSFSKWFCGHYHCDKEISENFVMLHEQIINII